MDVDSLVSEELRLQMYTKEVLCPALLGGTSGVEVNPFPAEPLLWQSLTSAVI